MAPGLRPGERLGSDAAHAAAFPGAGHADGEVPPRSRGGAPVARAQRGEGRFRRSGGRPEASAEGVQRAARRDRPGAQGGRGHPGGQERTRSRRTTTSSGGSPARARASSTWRGCTRSPRRSVPRSAATAGGRSTRRTRRRRRDPPSGEASSASSSSSEAPPAEASSTETSPAGSPSPTAAAASSPAEVLIPPLAWAAGPGRPGLFPFPAFRPDPPRFFDSPLLAAGLGGEIRPAQSRRRSPR